MGVSQQQESQHFRFIQFSPVRAMRGVSAARVEVDKDGHWLWMNEREICLNMRDFGEHPELHKALDAYHKGVAVEVTA